MNGNGRAGDGILANSNTIFDLKNGNAQTRWSVIDAHARLWMSACLFATDLLAVYAAFLIASGLRGLPQLLTSASYKELFALLAITLPVLFYRTGLYPAVGMHYVDEFRHIVSATSLAYLILIGGTFFLQTTLVYSRLVLLLGGVLSMGLISLFRYLMRRQLIRWGLWGEPSLIIGDSRKARLLVKYFMVNLQFGIRPVAALSHKPLAATKAVARKVSIKTALVLMDDIEDAHLLVEKYRFIFRRVILIKDQQDNYALTGMQTLDFLNVIGLQVKNDLLNDSSRIIKRTVDMLGSFFGLLALAPLLGLVAILIKLDSRGAVFYRQARLGKDHAMSDAMPYDEVFYRQARVGKDGAVFHLLKFRTMHYNAAQLLIETLENDIKLKQEWDAYQKLENDPRITRVGRFLRKFSIDELPQLWNVLVGQMSLVGPRPFTVDQRKMYGKNINNYIRVRPGMTGLWQVSGRNETTFARRVAFDREYIQRWSLWLDIYILLKTIKIVLFNNNTGVDASHRE